ncbi:MAG: hypothetical protein WA373_04605 [Burkholderiales bacterium]
MLTLVQRCLVVLITALPFAFATVASASSTDADRRLSDALEQALPSLVSSEDYWSASKLYFQLAAARSRLKETAAACTALSQSLAHYRKALAKDTGAPLDETATDSSNDEGLAEVGSKFGCANTWSALSDGSAASLEQALPTVVSSGDYRSASKLYFQLATARDRQKETAAACAALSQSLAYYRKAIAKDTGAPLDEASTDSSNSETLAEARSKFGCTNTGSAAANSLENVLPVLLSSGDDRSASKVYLLLATARSRINETPAACAALAQSLYHYRKALARDTGASLEEIASDSDEDDGLAEVRAKFSCASIRPELSAGLETSRH